MGGEISGGVAQPKPSLGGAQPFDQVVRFLSHWRTTFWALGFASMVLAPGTNNQLFSHGHR